MTGLLAARNLTNTPIQVNRESDNRCLGQLDFALGKMAAIPDGRCQVGERTAAGEAYTVTGPQFFAHVRMGGADWTHVFVEGETVSLAQFSAV